MYDPEAAKLDEERKKQEKAKKAENEKLLLQKLVSTGYVFSLSKCYVNPILQWGRPGHQVLKRNNRLKL